VRILLDESLPRPLGQMLVGHEVSTVADQGWTKLTNGALLLKAATSFDVLLTADQNIEFQQNLATLPLAVIVLVAESNRLESLEPLVPSVLEALKSVNANTLLRVGGHHT
jgi:predicted nuclease of predicted toxin-antitoxin system